MNVELPNDSEELIKVLGDRIEEIERTLFEDEDFCTKDIDATYQAAVKYFKCFEVKFHEKLNELEDKLDQIREKNISTSEQNRKQFDDEMEEINQLFSSGQHQEALEKFHDYEKRFEQRTTIIQNIPKLYMNDIDINQYFSIDKPIVPPTVPLNVNKQNSVDNTKRTKTNFLTNEHDDSDELESIKPCFDIRFKPSTSEHTGNNKNLSNKEPQTPPSVASPRSLRFSTRLTASSSTKSLSAVKQHTGSPPLLKPSNSQNFRENIPSDTQVRSTPSSPIIQPLMQLSIPTVKNSKGDGLSSTCGNNCQTKRHSACRFVQYQHERNTSSIMRCNQNYMILFRSQADRSNRWCSIIFDRSNLTQRDSQWHNLFIKSIGFIDEQNIYIFTEREFLIYSFDLSTKHYSRILLNDSNYNSTYHNVHLGYGGTVHDKYIYHIYLNVNYHCILSVLELATINHICDYDLTECVPDIKRFVDICITDQTMSFLVEMDGAQYAVIFCSNNMNSKMKFKRLIQLSYAGNPLTICSAYIHYIKKDIYFINDPSAKIIHILTSDKYLQSYSIIAHTLCYVEDKQELILTSNDGIYSININEQQNFFSKFR